MDQLCLSAMGFLFNSVNEEPQQETGRRQGNGFINHGMRLGPFIASFFFIFMLQFFKIKI